MDDYSKLSASDGTGEAVVANIENDRSIGATTLDVDNVENWPAEFIFVTGTLNPNNYISNASMTIMYGHLDAGNIVIDGYADGYTDVGNTAGQIAIIKPTTEWVNQVVGLARVAHDDDGRLKTTSLDHFFRPSEVGPNDFVVSGGVVAQVSGLNGSFSDSIHYINGLRYTKTEANKAYTISKDTYVDIGTDGTVDYNEVANGAAAPALAANHLRLAKVVTNASAITSVTQDGYDGLGNPIRPLEPIRQPKVLNPYVFSAAQSSNQTGITQGTWTTVTLGTENFDPNNNFASNTYTAPVAGFYLFCGEAQVNATTTGNGNGAGVRFLKNGSAALATNSWYDNNVSTDFDRRSISTIVQLAAGDTVVMQALGYTVSGTVLFTGSIFSGALISRL